MIELKTADALRLFEICNKAANRTRVDDEDDRHDFALIAFERFFAKERADNTSEYMWAYAQATISGLVKSKWARERKLLRESNCVNDEGDSYFEWILPSSSGGQENHVDADFWQRRIGEMPEYHRQTLQVLADGGTPLDLCNGTARPADVLKATALARANVRECGARKQLERARWPEGPECVECGSRDVAWLNERAKYSCGACFALFGALSKTPLNVFLGPWGPVNDQRRVKRPYRTFCEIAEMLREDAGPTQIADQFDMPYMLAYEIHGASLATPWFATMAGRPPSVIEAPANTPKERIPRARRPKAKTPPKPRVPKAPRTAENVTRVGEWEQEELDIVRNRWDAGRSGLEIARELGRSRNSVLGKIHRLGLMRMERAA